MEDKCEQDLFCGVNKAKSNKIEDMTDLEKKHTPVIDVEGDGPYNVSIKAGELLKHPNEHGHFIQYIELFSGHTFLGRVDFASERTDPVALFNVNLEHKHPLMAVVHCNLHGSWVAVKEL